MPSVRNFTGSPLWSSLRSTRMTPRVPGVTGLSCLSAMSSDSRRHVDGLAGRERDDRLLVVRPLALHAAEELLLAHRAQCVDGLHLDAEQGFDRGLDLGLAGIQRHLERD